MYGKPYEGKLFPALIQQVAFPLGFGGIKAADLIGWAEDHEYPGLTQLLTLRSSSFCHASCLGKKPKLHEINRKL